MPSLAVCGNPREIMHSVHSEFDHVYLSWWSSRFGCETESLWEITHQVSKMGGEGYPAPGYSFTEWKGIDG